VLEGRWRGGSTVTAPVPSSPVFAYKNRGMESKKKGSTRRILAKIAKINKNFILFVF
jgi:hypothetical protein